MAYEYHSKNKNMAYVCRRPGCTANVSVRDILTNAIKWNSVNSRDAPRCDPLETVNYVQEKA